MNVNEMTAAECADWCASDDGLGPICGQHGKERWDSLPDGESFPVADPYPLTLDGAAAALPDGWEWWKDATDWIAQAPHSKFVYVTQTGDEILDRYRLGVLCRMAAKEDAT